MSTMGGPVGDPDAAPSTAETVAGFLAASAMAVAIIALALHPLRLLAPALILSMLAAGIGGRAKGLAGAAGSTGANWFFFPMVISGLTSPALWERPRRTYTEFSVTARRRRAQCGVPRPS